MNKVTAKRRIRVATRDHAIISILHLKLHRGMICFTVTILILLGFVTFIVVEFAQLNIDSEGEPEREGNRSHVKGVIFVLAMLLVLALLAIVALD